MKKMLGIIGSSRRHGNCELMVREISRQIPQPHQLQLLNLPELDLRYCHGCYHCLFKSQRCVINDDLEFVLSAIAQADALILAVPTYFLSAHSCLKKLLDRGLAFYGRSEELWGKPAIGIGVAGIEGKEGSTLLDIERFLSALFTQSKGNRIVYGALPGEVLQDQANLRVAAELGHALFAPVTEEKDALHCQLCGGETFRFLAGGRVRCMLCSTAGELSFDRDQPALKMDPDPLALLGSPAQALEHRDWLRGMVGRYKEKREVLNAVIAGAGEEGVWLKPSAKKPHSDS